MPWNPLTQTFPAFDLAEPPPEPALVNKVCLQFRVIKEIVPHTPRSWVTYGRVKEMGIPSHVSGGIVFNQGGGHAA